MKRTLTLAAVAFLAIGSAASAATLSLVGGVAGSIPGVSEKSTPENDVLENVFGLSSASGFFGSQVTGAAGSYRVDYFGAEAGFSNAFNFGGKSVGNTGVEYAANPTTPISSFVVSSAGGLLDFNFSSNGTTAVTNGSNPVGTHGIANFWASFDPLSNLASNVTSGDVLWLFYDDNGVAGDNHDDLAVRISAVPVPAAGLFLLTGMGALALRRRRKAAA